MIDPDAHIHPTSVIEQGASIGPGCRVGPFCTIGSGVVLTRDVVLHSHVALAGNTRIGDGTVIWPFASVGHQPQDLKYAGEETRLEIGARNMIRESVSINPGTAGGGGLTSIGDDCLFMLGSHVGHDCQVGNRAVVANGVALAGHVTLGDHVILGGLSGVVQHCRIGSGAIVGAGSIVAADVIPHALVVGSRGRLDGLNLIGLKRRGVPRAQISALRQAYDTLFAPGGTLAERVALVAAHHPGNPLVQDIIAFLLAPSRRSFCLPPGNGE